VHKFYKFGKSTTVWSKTIELDYLLKYFSRTVAVVGITSWRFHIWLSNLSQISFNSFRSHPAQSYFQNVREPSLQKPVVNALHSNTAVYTEPFTLFPTTVFAHFSHWHSLTIKTIS